MPRIPQEIVRQIYERADIVEVIGQYLPLKKKGSNYWALSPFKTEKTPSFAVSPVKQIFKDFSSGKGGNVVTFLMEIEGFTYYEALRWLAKFYNIEIPENISDEEKQKISRREQLLVLMNFAVKYYYDRLFKNPDPFRYVQERGISEKTLKKFRVGYAPATKTAFVEHASKHGYARDLLLEAGLAVAQEGNTLLLKDKFSHRIMFPIFTPSGKAVAFGGRTLYNSPNVPKYLNSATNILYNKSKELFGLYQNKENIRRDRKVIITEGYFDVLALYEAEIYYGTATCGTAFTEEHAVLLKRYAEELILLFDADEAGQNAAKKTIHTALANGFQEIYLVNLPENEDPASFFLKYGKTKLQEALQQKTYFLDFLVRSYGGLEFLKANPALTAKFIRSLSETLVKIPDDLFRAVLMKKIASLLEVPVEEIKKNIVKFEEKNLKRKHQQKLRIAKHQESLGFKYYLEKELVRTLLTNHSYEDFQDVKESILQEIDFENELFRKIVRLFLEAETRNQDPVEALLTAEDTDLRNFVSELLMFPGEISEGWKNIDAVVASFEDKREFNIENVFKLYNLHLLQNEIEKTQKELTNPELPEEEFVKRMQELQNLLSVRKELCDSLGIKLFIIGGENMIKL